ncbi:MAG: hypothetical protein E7256_02775 [Lachnospiraceae bacterium]|nr:hypothetical protein [Lachnospiraceae bacterium]
MERLEFRIFYLTDNDDDRKVDAIWFKGWEQLETRILVESDQTDYGTYDTIMSGPCFESTLDVYRYLWYRKQASSAD